MNAPERIYVTQYDFEHMEKRHYHARCNNDDIEYVRADLAVGQTMKTYEVYLKGPDPKRVIAVVQAENSREAHKKGREEAARNGHCYTYDDCGVRLKKDKHGGRR